MAASRGAFAAMGNEEREMGGEVEGGMKGRWKSEMGFLPQSLRP